MRANGERVYVCSMCDVCMCGMKMFGFVATILLLMQQRLTLILYIPQPENSSLFIKMFVFFSLAFFSLGHIEAYKRQVDRQKKDWVDEEGQRVKLKVIGEANTWNCNINGYLFEQIASFRKKNKFLACSATVLYRSLNEIFKLPFIFSHHILSSHFSRPQPVPSNTVHICAQPK